MTSYLQRNHKVEPNLQIISGLSNRLHVSAAARPPAVTEAAEVTFSCPPAALPPRRS